MIQQDALIRRYVNEAVLEATTEMYNDKQLVPRGFMLVHFPQRAITEKLDMPFVRYLTEPDVTDTKTWAYMKVMYDILVQESADAHVDFDLLAVVVLYDMWMVERAPEELDFKNLLRPSQQPDRRTAIVCADRRKGGNLDRYYPYCEKDGQIVFDSHPFKIPEESIFLGHLASLWPAGA